MACINFENKQFYEGLDFLNGQLFISMPIIETLFLNENGDYGEGWSAI